MMDCDIVDEVHIARKQYLDGSIPTGFQRTAIVGVSGSLPFRGRRLTVTQISVEEDSCREVLDRGHLIVWRADRLGMPLIENVTEPELTTPEEVEAAILLIGGSAVPQVTSGSVSVPAGKMSMSRSAADSGSRSRASPRPGEQTGRSRRGCPTARATRLRDELQARGFKNRDDIVMQHKDVTELTSKSQL